MGDQLPFFYHALEAAVKVLIHPALHRPGKGNIALLAPEEIIHKEQGDTEDENEDADITDESGDSV